MLIRILGRGGFGQVEEIITPSGKVVARKSLRLNGDEIDSDLIRRFKREVSYQRNFYHKNIVPILSSNLDAYPPFFDMPLATCDLGKELNTNKLNSVKSKVYPFLCLLSGVEHIHMRGQLHRDIKPENLLRFDYNDGSHIYKLSDFGLISQAKGSVTTNITRLGSGFGSERFLAGELFRHGFEAATPQSDIYSIGVVLFSLFASTQEIAQSFPYTVRKTSHPMKRVIIRSTAAKPVERYENIAELRSEFLLIAGQLQGVEI